MSTLIAGGTVVTATDTYAADVLVEGETIAAIGSGFSADTVLDAAGKYVLPGGIDVHTHFDTPQLTSHTADDFESGTIAAAIGGTTTCVNFAYTRRGDDPQASLEAWHRKAEGKAAADYGLHMVLTEITPQTQAGMDRLVRDEGVTSFKLFMAYKHRQMMLDDESIFRALRRTAENGALVQVHAENGGVIDTLVQQALAEGNRAPRYHALTRPTRGEAEATGRAVALAEMAGVPVYVVHVSCADALAAIREGRDRGLPAYAETCPQYLFLSVEKLAESGLEGAKYVCSPPLREAWNQDALWTGLAHDDLQVVSTDHCPFCLNEKQLGQDDFSQIPNGLPGVEHRLSLIYDGGVRTGRISLNRFVQLTATAPAKIFGMYPRKGAIAVGSDADLVIFDPAATHTISAKTHHMRVDYSVYEGRSVTGMPDTVLSRGLVIVDNGRYVGTPGHGKFVRRALFQPPS
jgi:dihydropyrimidinase